ncbi:MAG TPA: lysophospholipid acyltransferase family protein [Candidatus Limnocylindrales bacterium]|nr:lysophospholipid acyltransferase family protein [Candidatus Limnocylindrales bacterium]
MGGGAAPPPGRVRRARPALPFGFRLGNIGIRFALWVLRTRIVVEGVERIPDRPSVILASNHLSIMDPPILSVVLERCVRRQVRYMAKAEALGYPLVGWMLVHYGGFGVHRGQPDREAYRMALGVLTAGDWLGVAPEGTRSRTGHLGEPKPGMALLAQRSGSPILPVGIYGTERLWPVGARLPRFGTTVTIRFGAAYLPLDPGADGASAARADRRAATAAISEDLMRRIAALLPASYQGRFG